MVFWKALEISKTKIMGLSEYAIAVILQRERIPDACAYDTVMSTPSVVYYSSEYVIYYWLYWLSVSAVFTLKYIMGLSIFVSSGSKERKNGALKVVDVAIFS